MHVRPIGEHRQERLAVNLLINFDPREFQQGGHDIDVADLSGRDALELLVAGHLDDERHANQRFVKPFGLAGQTELPAEAALIGRENNHCVVVKPFGLERRDEPADRFINERDLPIHDSENLSPVLL